MNGKFLVQRLTGVQRFANELLMAVDAALPRLGGLSRWVLLHPPNASLPDYKHIRLQPAGGMNWPAHLWEQLALPVAARSGLLLNLAGSAPYFARRQVCTFHDAAVFDRPEAYTWQFNTWYRALFRHAGRTASKLVTVSEFSRQRIAERLSLDADRIGIVSNAADHIRRVKALPGVVERMGLQPRRYVLVIATDSPNKNLATLQKAIPLLPTELGLQFVLVGGSNPAVFSAGAAEAVRGHLIRTGPVSDQEMKALLEGALALALPSFYEGFGLPALEAMATGCPVLVSNAAALPEVCGDAALYADPGEPGQMAGALVRLASDAQLWESMRAAGLARSAQFSWSSSAERLLCLVGSLA